ncbi:uncharacterized protein JN550_011688 [Neoarthrinium moseri]|uniref:uncharacterized protein n=1 Tax=Neoarthrinium moseri TaxID=1658444 RepID=UPI001FDDCEA2|nr:uncharacterized protein JN550_011688 [Neoarthrinium moseri]KAI1860004.1 hypothetical protein JN550_011688 [Neoarthrinium moseri]
MAPRPTVVSLAARLGAGTPPGLAARLGALPLSRTAAPRCSRGFPEPLSPSAAPVRSYYKQRKAGTQDSAQHRYREAQDQNAWLVDGTQADASEGAPLRITHPESRHTLVLNRRSLRDACACERCVDPHSGQKTFGTTAIPAALPIESTQRLVDGSLRVVWARDFLSSGGPHQSTYPPSTIRSWFAGRREGAPRTPGLSLWNRREFEASPHTVTYEAWMSAGPDFHAALAQLRQFGLVFIDGVPHSEDSVVALASQIGNILETLYGRTWDVRSKPQAENVAYTSSFLGLHQDLLYTSRPPRLQFLHCLENTCDGGESIFSDAYAAAAVIKKLPYHAAPLYNFPIRYHYKKNGHSYEKLRPVFEKAGGVYWSPPFQTSDQPWEKSTEGDVSYSRWFQAAQEFRRRLEHETSVYERKLKPGQCVVFDNLRVLHGRRRFDTASGNRWLKGTYIADDVWKSKLYVLAEEIKAKFHQNDSATGPSKDTGGGSGSA